MKQQQALSPAAIERNASCDGIRRWLEVFARSDRRGEVGAIKAALAASAVSDDELIQLGRAERERRDALQRANQPLAAASAASTPSVDASAPDAEMPTIASTAPETRQ